MATALDIFTQIGILRSLNENKIKKGNNSASSLNGDKSPLSFITDLLRTLFGPNEFLNIIVETLINELPSVADDFKKGIAECFLENYACNLTANKFPAFYFDVNIGMTIDVKKIDPFKILRIDPNSYGGKMIYGNDNQKDLNRYIYDTIQGSNGGSYNGLFTMTYNEAPEMLTGEQNMAANTIKVALDTSFQTKQYSEFINSYMNALQNIMNIDQVLPKLIDLLFGVISNLNDIGDLCTKNEEMAMAMVEKIATADCNVSIDDSFYTFSNNDLKAIDELAKNRSRGVTVLTECGGVETTFNLNRFLFKLKQFQKTNNPSEKQELLYEVLNTVITDSTKKMNKENKDTAKQGILERIIKFLIRIIGGTILSPQVLMLFSITNIVFVGKSNIDDVITFIRKHINCIFGVIFKMLRKLIIILLKKILRKIKDLIAAEIAARLAEKLELKKLALLSLLPIPKQTTDFLKSVK